MSKYAADQQALRYANDLAKMQQLRRTYEKLIPKGLEGIEPPPPVLGNVTILFTDIRGFTHLTERLAQDPSALLDVLNAHLAVVVRAITICGGTIEKFMGDGVMASFGARTEHHDHTERAIAAAIGIVGANEGLNRRRAGDWGFRLDVGAGVASGPVVIGAIGPPERWELGVLGDAINVAARLADQARSGEVLMTGTVYSDVSTKLEVELTDQSAVRGRSGSLEIYRLSVLAAG